jgi:hypothetical protein
MPTMPWPSLLSYVFGGALLANAVPHIVSAMTGRAFQTPFAKPPGEGLSSSTVNLLWGFGNLVAAYLVIRHAGLFDWRSLPDALALGTGLFASGLFSARLFGRFHGGRAPAPREQG